jgi:hypothetical protein
MDSELVLRTIRSIEDRRPVTLARLASELSTDLATLQPVLDAMLADGSLCKSELAVRPNEGYDFKLRETWYHTPEREVTSRFGSIIATDGARTRPPRSSVDAPVSLAS